jgi:hypothetical protein
MVTTNESLSEITLNRHIPPICVQCRHWQRAVPPHIFCAAYPAGKSAGVPDAIRYNEHDHRQPYEGDNGIQFEPAKRG